MYHFCITPGEPAGIGIDCAIKLAQFDHPYALTFIADASLLKQRAKQLKYPLKIKPYQPHSITKHQAGEMRVVNIPLNAPVNAGLLNAANAPYVLQCLQRAHLGCLQFEFSGVVTGPVHKGIINDANITFSGHTEFFASQCQCPVVMMLMSPQLKVALVTTHIPLKKVAQTLNQNLLQQTLEIIDRDYQRYFASRRPTIAVAGLNPHAGENGHIGGEEIHIISPVIQRLQKQGLRVNGPFSADTLFTPTHALNHDVIVAMYHDQGLPVLKASGFGEAVNVTLGLPYIRTSVDHGTAIDLAGTGQANPQSLQTALETAALMAEIKVVA